MKKYNTQTRESQEFKTKKNSVPERERLGSNKSLNSIPFEELKSLLPREEFKSAKKRARGAFISEPPEPPRLPEGWKNEVISPDEVKNCKGRNGFRVVVPKDDISVDKLRVKPFGCGCLNCERCKDWVHERRYARVMERFRLFYSVIWIKMVFTVPEIVEYMLYQDKRLFQALRLLVIVCVKWFLAWKWGKGEIGGLIVCHPVNDEGRFHPHWEVLVPVVVYRDGVLVRVKRRNNGKKNPAWVSETERKVLRWMWCYLLVRVFGSRIGLVNPVEWLYRKRWGHKKHAVEYAVRPFTGWGSLNGYSWFGFMWGRKWKQILERRSVGVEAVRFSARDGWITVAYYIRRKFRGVPYYDLVWKDEEVEKILARGSPGFKFAEQIWAADVDKEFDKLDGSEGATK